MSVAESNSLKSIPNINLQQIYAEEEDDNVVYSIREELIQNVLAQTDKISQERRIVKLVTECACEALKKLISIHFYHHAASPGTDDQAWAPDVPIAPSPPDTWATKNVPVRPIPEKEEAMKEEISISTPERRSCTCDLGVKCLCYLDSEERIRDQIEILYAPETKKVPRSTSTSKVDLEDAANEDDAAALEAKEPSLDKKLDGKESIPCVLKEGFSKIGIATNTLKLPKIEVPLPAFKRSELNVLELPPIRVAATFQAVTREVPQQKKTKKKKNKKDKKK